MLTGVIFKYASAGLLALCLVLFALYSMEKRGAQKWKARAGYYQSELARVIDAAEQAERLNKAEVARIKQEQDHVTREVESNLTARLERLRRELRSEADKRNSEGTGAGPDGESRPGTPEATGVCLTPEELLRGAENEERHDQLIRWIERQLEVER